MRKGNKRIKYKRDKRLMIYFLLMHFLYFSCFLLSPFLSHFFFSEQKIESKHAFSQVFYFLKIFLWRIHHSLVSFPLKWTLSHKSSQSTPFNDFFSHSFFFTLIFDATSKDLKLKIINLSIEGLVFKCVFQKVNKQGSESLGMKLKKGTRDLT